MCLKTYTVWATEQAVYVASVMQNDIVRGLKKLHFVLRELFYQHKFPCSSIGRAFGC